MTDGKSGSLTTLTYDKSNHLTGFTVDDHKGTISNYTVTTNAQGLVTQYLLNGQPANSFTTTKVTAAYNGNNRLTQVQVYLESPAVLFVTEDLSYNSNGQLDQLKTALVVTGSKGQDSTVYTYALYTYSNSSTMNPSTITSYSGSATGKTGSPNVTQTFTFDTKHSNGGGFPGSLDSFNTIASNNILTAQSAYHFSSGDTNVNQTFTYQYNSSDYPVSKVYQYNGNSVTDTYTYSNCK
ncbi:hypothetical protein WSM22_28600 [Cytophagales bacterium WSM2-2]|nr:hypothetical protein WSM22_28600 [Cytophagales bacterium WSM2-2]